MMVAQAGSEWGHKDAVPRIVDALVAGDNAVTTDACVMRIMGLDPSSDWNRPPFHRDRNPLLASAESGYGTIDPALVDFQFEVEPQPDGAFFSIQPDSAETVRLWRKTMSEQALFYRDNRQLFEQYAGSYIMLQDGEVIWHGTDPIFEESRRSLAGAKPDSAAWIKFVDPAEEEGIISKCTNAHWRGLI